MEKKANLRILSILLAFVLVCTSFISTPIVASAMPGEFEISYEVKADGTAKIIRNYSAEASGDLVIPEYIDGYKVTEIGEAAFSWNSDVTSLTIPETVTTIGDSAFRGLAITKLVIPKSVTKMGEAAFCNNQSLASISFQEGTSISEIGTYMFCYSKIKSIKIPASVKKIGNGAFSGCENLETVTFPKNTKVTAIANGAFLSCIKLKTITLPETVNSIGKQAFASCTTLSSVNIPSKVTKIEYATFADCNGLKSYTIPKNVKSIDNAAFYNCKNLKSVTVSNATAKIAKYALGYNADGITNVTVSTDWESPARLADNFTLKGTDNKNTNTTYKYASTNRITYYYGSKYVLAGPTCYAQSTKDGIKVAWSKVANAKSYTLYKKNSKGKWDKVTTFANNSYVDKKATTNGTKYEYKVTCTDKKVKTDVTGNELAYVKLNPVKVTSAAGTTTKWDEANWKYNPGKLTVNFANNSSAEGYELQYSSDKSFQYFSMVKIKKSGQTVDAYIYHDEWNPHTYVRVIPYKTVGKTVSYGLASNVVEINFTE